MEWFVIMYGFENETRLKINLSGGIFSHGCKKDLNYGGRRARFS